MQGNKNVLSSLQIVKEKDRFRKAPANYAMKKTQLLKDKVREICRDPNSIVMVWLFGLFSDSFLPSFRLKAMAEEVGDNEKVKKIQDEMKELEERAEALDRQRTKSISAIRYTSNRYQGL